MNLPDTALATVRAALKQLRKENLVRLQNHIDHQPHKILLTGAICAVQQNTVRY